MKILRCNMKKLLLISIQILLLAPSISCQTKMQPDVESATELSSRVQRIIKRTNPNFSALKKEMLQQDILKSFNDQHSGQGPGLVCDNFGCAVLVVDDEKQGRIDRLFWIDKMENIQLLEDYSDSSGDRSNYYIASLSEKDLRHIRSKGFADSKGFKRIAYEQSEVIFLWRDNGFTKIWTSD